MATVADPDNDKIAAALDLIHRYAGIDGAHHKQWLLDQVVRALTGDSYLDWVKEWENDVTDGGDDDEIEAWDVGIAP